MADRVFVVAGEALVDIVVPAAGTGAGVRTPGGSPLNVAVGLARLEVPTRLVTELGEDEHGRLVRVHLEESRVQLADTAVRPGRRTSTATARLDAGHAAAYEFDLGWELVPHELPEDALGLHVGSIGAALAPGRAAVVDLVRQAGEHGVFVSYDLNVRPAFLPDRERAWRDVLEIAAGARLVKLSDEDLEALQPGRSAEEVAGTLLAAPSTEMVVVTAGAQGAAAFTDSAAVRVASRQARVLDTVGAGDSFMAGLLAALVDWDLTLAGEDALRVLAEERIGLLLNGAATAAAITVARRGADPPTRAELPATWPAG